MIRTSIEKMKVISLTFFALFSFILSSCSDSIQHQGIYDGNIEMEDGVNRITLELKKNGDAQLDGLYEESVHGEWLVERVGGFYEDDVWATFKFPEYRVRLKLKSEKEGLVLASMTARLEGKTILRTLHLKKKNPFLKKRDI